MMYRHLGLNPCLVVLIGYRFSSRNKEFKDLHELSTAV
jgi:hypothetical protein